MPRKYFLWRLGLPIHAVAQCASLVLAFSRRLFIRYYPRFTRFEVKAFLHDAFTFMDGTCPRCIIDNTSVIVVAGSGDDAVVDPKCAASPKLMA